MPPCTRAQHRLTKDYSTLLTLHHSDGTLTLTPDHVLLVDQRMATAREAVVGTKLSLAEGREVEVTSVTVGLGAVINVVTVSGRIVADGVLAGAYPEWISEWMLRSLVPVPFSLGNLISYLFPDATQAYYDRLEPLVGMATPTLLFLKRALPSPLVLLTFVLGDIAASLGFATFSLATSEAAIALLAALLLATYTARPRKSS